MVIFLIPNGKLLPNRNVDNINVGLCIIHFTYEHARTSVNIWVLRASRFLYAQLKTCTTIAQPLNLLHYGEVHTGFKAAYNRTLDKTIKTEKGEQIMKTTIKWFLKFASEYDYMCSQPWVEHPDMQQK